MKTSYNNACKMLKRLKQNINFGKVFILQLCITVIIQGFMISPSYAEPETKTMTITIDESMTQNRSKTITIPYLKSIEGVSVNTGNVDYSVDGDNITFNVSGGSPSSQKHNPQKYSKTVTDYEIQGSSSFSATMEYDDGEYNGTIDKTGSSYVISGSTADNKDITMDTYVKEYERRRVIKYNKPGDYDTKDIDASYEWDDPNWSHVNGCGGEETTRHPLRASKFNYRDIYGYTGALGNRTHHRDDDIDYYNDPKYPSVGDVFKTRCYTWEITYSGTIYKPDTRKWRQKYTGTAYKGGYDDYYSYKVTLEYIDNSDPSISVSKPTENEYFG